MKNKSSIDTGNNSFTMPDGAVLDLANKSPKEVINAYLAYKNRPSIDTKDHLDGEQAVTNLTPEQAKGLNDGENVSPEVRQMVSDNFKDLLWKDPNLSSKLPLQPAPTKDQYICRGAHCKCTNQDGTCKNYHAGDHTCPTSTAQATPTKDHCSINVTGYCETHDREWSDCKKNIIFLKSNPKATPTALSSIDEILSQAFTDGASDTMWQNDRHVEIFATAKAKLEAYIEENYDAKN